MSQVALPRNSTNQNAVNGFAGQSTEEIESESEEYFPQSLIEGEHDDDNLFDDDGF
jgi:hypothetical protein